MCRFKLAYKVVTENIVKFQYILCVGSRLKRKHKSMQLIRFNTSYVSVQDEYESTIMWGVFVSIHLMCRFKLR